MDLYVTTVAERKRLAGLLAEHPEAWGADSLCAGWRVREVIAHLTMPYRYRIPAILLGIDRARGDFNRFSNRAALRDTELLSDPELLENYADNAESRWTPPGGGQVGALSHDVIHGLDITMPLGLPEPDPAVTGTVLSEVRPKQLKYFGVDLTGVRLEASDADVAVGSGRAVTMSAAELLMIVTGRKAVPRVV
ncbi:maleylpyruvate isomerase family mycothiol-dependent enzyme [Tsukamurella sp. 8F]|uniref:maleylpyruvate isomerase family mycothiol-dependent enzyme n=1 Tax=unclassified Tsukamurella TaxID=2633480 RepID=UPI0023BA12A0|nr:MULTISPECIES: maleylpyruvate isomerase family mycothiol-dependent enzyme [unclassified Tsukamurella]MDF0531930.1 maleylpyruvate isomerase family mycothiol-dependent enzyme [Tsukamurella sp. 8J]MDF0586930.1 maleylpyruvate isomerase family mycothiol-dependent enzyme [Tsukamurella sp. 8F]